MDFNLSEEQEMLKETAKRFIAEQCPKEFVREMEEDENGYTKELWQQIAELGWLGLMLPEKYNGIGLGLMGLVLIMEEIGAGCFPGPFLETTLGALMILDSDNEKLKDELLPMAGAGEAIITLAYLEPGNTVYDPAYVTTTANAEGDGYILNGKKLFVQNANTADYLVVSARTGGDDLSEDGISLFLVPAKDGGVEINPLKTIAGDKQFEVVFNNIKVDGSAILGAEGKGFEILEKNLQIGAVASSAHMVGGAEAVMNIAVDYARVREQFGNPIGRFQAVQHHAANMIIDVSGSRYITYKAAWTIDQNLPGEMMVASAKGFTSDAYNRVAALAHQIGAGTAFIVEDDTTLYSRRAKADELAYGDAAYHRKRAAKALGL